MPSFCLYFVTKFFLMVLTCYFSFLTIYLPLHLLPSALPSHHSAKAVSGKSHQETRWPNPLTSFSPHLSSPFYTTWLNEYLPSIFLSSLVVETLFPLVLQSSGPFTSSFSAHLLDAGALRGAILSVRAPVSPFFALSRSASSVVIHLPWTPTCGCFLPSSVLQTSVPAAYWTPPLWLPRLVGIFQWQVIGR